jgi:hypothetical protein
LHRFHSEPADWLKGAVCAFLAALLVALDLHWGHTG